MKKIKNKIVLFLIVIAVFLCASKASAAEEGLIHKLLKKFRTPAEKSDIKETEEKKQEEATPIIKEGGSTHLGEAASEMTKAGIVQEIKDEVEAEEEILDNIPALKKSRDVAGKESYTYRVSDKDIKLEDLDRDTLNAILTKVYNQSAMLRAEAIREQMEAVRSVQNIPRALAPAPSPPTLPPRPPSSRK
jgi:hypothetical protein